MTDLRIVVDGRELAAEWTGENPKTRAALADALPLSGEARRWGEELYFGTDVDVPGEDTQTEVAVGAIAYWPQGNAVCLFWGPTPASTGPEPRAASPVSVVGEILDVEPLRDIEGNVPVRIERAR